MMAFTADEYQILILWDRNIQWEKRESWCQRNIFIAKVSQVAPLVADPPLEKTPEEKK